MIELDVALKIGTSNLDVAYQNSVGITGHYPAIPGPAKHSRLILSQG